MAYADIPGSKTVFIGPNIWLNDTSPGALSTTLDAANEAVILIGHIETSDGGSHTIDTSGSSSIQWRSATVVFASGSTTVKVGIAAVDTSAGPPGRAVNSSDVITFDVSKSLTGGGGGITTNAWQIHVPDSGTKTISNGDLIAICVQMTARGGTDSVQVTHAATGSALMRPTVTTFLSAAYAASNSIPNIILSFSDGALGWVYLGDVASARANLTFNSSSGTKEYGQLFNLPFPCKIYGIYGWVAPGGDFDVVLYSDPLGTPVAEKTITGDANTVPSTTNKRSITLFASSYTLPANTSVAAVFKPGGTNITVYSKTLNSAAHRVTDSWGTSGYGVSRASGAFANINSSLDHIYIGLLVGSFDAGGGAGGGGINVVGGKGGVIA